MLTFYTIVKGFEGPFAHIQRNAIRSWMLACPGCEVILFGDDERWAIEESIELGLTILPFKRNEHGAPLLPSVVEAANERARYSVRCLINADIILEPRFKESVRSVDSDLDRFLLITRRAKVRTEREIDFEGDWRTWLRTLDCKLGIFSAIDLFCYRGDWLCEVPPFGVGRTSWDNWIVRRARSQDVPVVDGSAFFLAWHQEHKKHKAANEVAKNRALLGSSKYTGGLGSADWMLDVDGALQKKVQL